MQGAIALIFTSVSNTGTEYLEVTCFLHIPKMGFPDPYLRSRVSDGLFPAGGRERIGSLRDSVKTLFLQDPEREAGTLM